LKIPGSKPEAPVEAAPSPASSPESGFGGNDTPSPEPSAQPSSDDKPFDAEPFNAGVEADEESDPKKFIEQLTGKLGQSLRKYNEAQGNPDFELEKFAINSLLSASHTSEMQPQDQDDIIKKVKEAGNQNDDEDNTDDSKDNSNNNGSNDDGSNGEFTGNVGGNDHAAPASTAPTSNGMAENVEENEEGFLIKPKKMSIFAPEGSEEANFKHKIVEKLHETFNQEDEMSAPLLEPMVKPAPTKPAPLRTPNTQPSIAPSRKNKPFLPMPEVTPDPKAIKEALTKNKYEIYHDTLAQTLDEIQRYVQVRGYEPLKFDANSLQHVAYHTTSRIQNALVKAGQPQKVFLNAQIYRMDSGKYELNMYIQ
jgi:hypothetical protein